MRASHATGHNLSYLVLVHDREIVERQVISTSLKSIKLSLVIRIWQSKRGMRQ